VIHSMVQYNDGSVLAQMGNPDMRTPIAYALGWPQRIVSGVEHLDLFAVAQLNFEPPDFSRYPCLRLAIEAMERGGSATTIVNAVNEVAVEAFLNGEVGYLDIARMIESVLGDTALERVTTVEQVVEVDAEARHRAAEWMARR
jgi:1-deoxy-D-xylulose-5-phosphate reductoisomerase